MLIGSFPKYLHMIDIAGTHDQSQDRFSTQRTGILSDDGGLKSSQVTC